MAHLKILQLLDLLLDLAGNGLISPLLASARAER